MANRTNTVRPHSAPGLYFSENVETYTPKTTGITKLGVSGETLRGPAFQPISISNWKEFQQYFGGTSTAKFKGSQYPKYELPYIAKTYLEESNQLEVVRVLGLSGVNAGPAWVITATKHVVFNGYDYSQIYQDPFKGDETEWEDKGATYTTKDDMPAPPEIREGDKEYARVFSKYTWHTLCDDCKSDGELNPDQIKDLTEGDEVPDPNDPDFTYDYIKVYHDCYYENVGSASTGSIHFEPMETLPKATHSAPEYVAIPKESSTSTDPEYDYYMLHCVAYCYEKRKLYDYYQKVWKNGIQLAEEDNFEGNKNNMVIAVLRSRGEHKRAAFVRTPTEAEKENGICEDIYSYDGIQYYAKDIHLEPSKSLTLGSSCNPGFSANTGDFSIDSNNYGTFTIVVENMYGELKYYSVSLNPGEKNYIYNVIGGTPEDGDAEIYVEELYDVALKQLVDEGMFNAINSEIKKYPAINIVPQFADVNDLVEESVLSKRHHNKRYLYSTTYSNGIPVKYSEDGGKTWIDGDGFNGMIYTVFERMNTLTNKREYFYGAYVDRLAYEYKQLENEPENVEWIPCSQQISDEQQNAFDEQPDFFNNPATENPKYLRIGTGSGSEDPYLYYEKVITDYTASKNVKKPTEALTHFNYDEDVQDDRFTNCVRVAADDLMYVNTEIQVEDEEGNLQKFYDVIPITLDFNNYKEQYRYASTPWIVSEIKGSAEQVQLAKLFRFHTISDGNNASTEVKVSIENIDPSAGKFDVIVRNFIDSDLNPMILERFGGCTLIPGDSNYISYRIGSFDGKYNSVSNYITVEVVENDITKTSTPAGFLGYPMRNYSGFGIYNNSVDTLSTDPVQPYFRFNTDVVEDLKPKKQYFGVSDITGVDNDVFAYKGVEAYNNVPSGLTPCFHLDSRILNGTPDKDGYIVDGDLKQKVTVDELSGYSWVTVNKANVTSEGIEPRIGSDDVMAGTIYEDKKFRKFTVAFYGGWDGWDYYRTSRSNTDDYRSKNYKGNISAVSGYGDMFNVVKNAEAFDFGEMTEKVITSDYYAYLAGARMFNNPKDIEINVLATPGIDYVNNGGLVDNIVDMVEEERQDCVYVITTPDKPFGASDSKDSMYMPDEVVANLEDSDLDTNHATTYYPWVKYFDEDNSEYIYLPITRDVVKSIALCDNQYQPWFAAAGWNRGDISGVEPKLKLKLGEQDTLYDGRLNFVNCFGNEGCKIWGDKNLQIADNQLNRLSARRLMLRIKRLLQNACIGLIFDPNDNNCTKALKSAVSTVLESVKENRGIFDYKVEIDDSPSVTDQMGRVVRYWVRRSPMLEWIQFEGTITPNGVEW